MAMTVHGQYALGAEGLLTIMNKHQNEVSKSIERVSSGQRVNHAGDDPAGKAISDRMLTQIRSLEQSQDNTQNANSLLRVVDASISSMVDIITAMRTKALEAANDSLSKNDRDAVQMEIDQLKAQIDSNSYVTYNGKKLLTGDYGTIEELVTYDSDNPTYKDGEGNSVESLQFSSMKWKGENSIYFQVGPNKDDGIVTHLMNMTKDYIFKDVTIDVSNVEQAAKTAKDLDKSLTRALYQQTEIASVQERLEHTSNNIQGTTDETKSALSTMQDADMAAEMTKYAAKNLLLSATQAMMAQANTNLSKFIELIQGSL